MTHLKQYGGNMHDISPEEGLKLLISYWITYSEFTDSEYVFVGDVHGDFNQFIAPLISSKLIKLNPSLHSYQHSNNTSFPETTLFIPDYTILDGCTSTIIYLGDLVDEWIFSRTILHILKDLLTNEVSKKHIKFIYGNHDLSLIGRYQLFKDNLLKIPYDLPTTWNTIKKELNYSPNIKIYEDKILYKNDPKMGEQFLREYLDSLFDDLFYIFDNKLGYISCTGYINDTPYIISHTTWNPTSLWRLFKNIIPNYTSRPGDLIPEQKKPITNSSLPDKATSILEDILKHESRSIELIPNFSYEKLSWSCNSYIYTRSRLYISKNAISYSRQTKDIFLNQIIGHTPGGVYRNQGINSEPSIFEDERESKLKPKIYNNCKVFYFDFLTSAGYDHDEVSRPDFVICKNGDGFRLSNLNSFAFERNKNGCVLHVFKGKSKDKLFTLKGDDVKVINE